ILEEPKPLPLTNAEVEQFARSSLNLTCLGGDCSNDRPCSNCTAFIKKTRLENLEADHGETTNRNPPRPKTASAVILGYFHDKYQPAFKRGNIVVCANGDELTQQAVLIPDSIVLCRLTDAVDARRDNKSGTIDTEALPGLFRKWAP